MSLHNIYFEKLHFIFHHRKSGELKPRFEKREYSPTFRRDVDFDSAIIYQQYGRNLPTSRRKDYRRLH